MSDFAHLNFMDLWSWLFSPPLLVFLSSFKSLFSVLVLNAGATFFFLERPFGFGFSVVSPFQLFAFSGSSLPQSGYFFRSELYLNPAQGVFSLMGLILNFWG